MAHHDAKMARFCSFAPSSLLWGGWGIIVPFYSVQDCSSASGQDESNPALWLATWAGKMELSCLLGTTRLVLQEKFPQSHVINPLLTKCEVKMLDIGQVLFFASLWTETESRSIKKRTRPISSHLGQTSLVNKGFIIWLSGKFFLRDTAGNPEGTR